MSYSQKEHIEMLQQRKKSDVQRAAEVINSAYSSCVDGSESAFPKMIEELDKMYGGMVRRHLSIAGCNNDENQHTAMQEARIAVWELIKKSRDENMKISSFASYCKGIYYHKVGDVIRVASTVRSRFGENMPSIDETVPSENGTVGDFIAHPIDNGNQPDVTIANVEKRKLYDGIFKLYCQILTELDSEPPRKLALYYARILPHVLYVSFNVEAIPDNKVASPKWAIKRMGNKTIGMLGIESEKEMQQYISSQLIWCDGFWKRLDEMVNTSVGQDFMKNVIFTNEYDEKQIGHMTDYMHKIVAKEWLQQVKKDSKTLEDIVEYCKEMDKISGMVKGGESR
ncbi:RNA polymerase sigma factor [Hespellia stercorisuis]|uniref:Uncharacterized protein n=1 Tax=Hespellia stercorisuis DSM 15480 TaxID=1121950 RepID=A0A1M6WG59_9FIRM|nr:hypothetical protein [Hespellia stercorisuis]SHK92661.1 hypothetical protein SAMN02745243_04009 [Hespellia stercorisuis DSM 15480]